jgi:spore coat polysaccharide biosynthesis protein SpsF
MQQKIPTRIVATIEARTGSSRLPGKVMLPIMGKPLLELLIERLRRATCLSQIVVATTTSPGDDVLEELALRLGVGCFRGSEEDVLDRVLNAAKSVQAKVIVEITGDCPLIDPEIVDQMVEFYRLHDFDYVANNMRRTYPRGLDVQVFSTEILDQVARLTEDPYDHEHVSLYIYEHPERFSIHNVDSGLPQKSWDTRLTVDTKEDLDLITAIYEDLYPDNPEFGLQDILDLFERRPDLLEINAEIQQKPVR